MKALLIIIFCWAMAHAADVIKNPSDGNHAYIEDNDGNLLPLGIAYTTDGEGTVTSLNTLAAVNDDIQVPKNSGKMYLKDAAGKLYPAMVLYTTDGEGNISPITGGGSGGGGGGTWGSITGTLSSQTDLQNALNAKEATANKTTNLSSPNNTKFPTSQAVVTGLALKEDAITGTSSSDYWGGDKAFHSLVSLPISTATQTALNAKEGSITGTSSSDYWGGDKSFHSILSLPIQTSVQDALDDIIADMLAFPLKAPTGTLSDAPSYGFGGGDDDTGIYSTGDGNVSIMANGTLKASFDQNTVTLYSGSGVTVNSDLTITGNIAAANYPPTGNSNSLAFFDGSGNLAAIPDNYVNGEGFLSFNRTVQPNDDGGKNYVEQYLRFDPLQDSVAESYNVFNSNIALDPNSSGFEMGTGGQFFNWFNLHIDHQGTSDVGAIAYFNTHNEFGNGTDPILVRAVSVFNGFGHMNDGVTISNELRGYGMNYLLEDGVVIQGTTTAFYDDNQFHTPAPGYVSFNSNAQLDAIANNHNSNTFSAGGRVKELQGNAGHTAYGCYSIIGEDGIGTGGVNCFYANPEVDNNNYYNGVYSSTQNVDNKPGTASSIVIQDLTITFSLPGDNNNLSVEYIDDGTAGSETAVLVGNNVQVHMEDGVSTASQIRTALLANVQLASAVTVTVTGVGSNPQIASAAANFSGGTNPGTKWAGYFEGDVNITGSLSFGGALSIGRLSAFGSLTPTDGGGNPGSVHTLISSINIPASSTTANFDTLGLNTAALINIGANSTNTSGALGIGLAALGLPAVIETHTGSNTDYLGASLFALNFSGTSDGGTIDTAYGGRWLAIPNGITTVNKYYGMWAQLPFGSIAAEEKGLYIQDFAFNSIEGELNVDGGVRLSTSGSQPTCDVDHRGMMWNLEGGAGVADILQVCQKTVLDTYSWVTH